MKIKQFINNPFQENTYIIYDELSKETAIVDCGALMAGEEAQIAKFIESEQLTVKYLLNTHLHLDHCFGNHWAATQYNIKPMAHELDKPLLALMNEQMRMFGLNMIVTPEPIANYLSDGDKLQLGSSPLEIIHTPGHSAGGVSIYAPNDGILLSGDSLFCGSIGRTDLEGGSYATLIRSIQTRLLTLSDSTIVFCGHGESTTIGDERTNNPYL